MQSYSVTESNGNAFYENISFIQTQLNKLSFYNSIEKDIERIIILVQNNPEYFDNVQRGDSCIKAAADKLEELLK